MNFTSRKLFLLSLLGAFALHAQVPQPSGQPLDDQHSFHPGQFYTIHHNVALVVLDGVAIDANGNPVTDLKQTDFHITEDGVPEPIRNFEEAGKYTPPPSVTINSASDLARLAPRAPVNIVLLDEFSTRFEDMAYARYSLQQWLKHQPAKLDTPTILIAVSLEHFEVLRDYTQNKDELMKALNSHFAANPWHLNQVTWNTDMIANAHLALRRVAEATRRHQGPKTMIWIGRGFPSNRKIKRGSDIENHPDSTTLNTLDELRDARVVLYTIDPAGVIVNPELAYPSEAGKHGIAVAFGGDPRFEAIAEATGGQAFSNRNDVDALIGKSIRDGLSVYTLTYIPPDPDIDKQKLRHISVTIDRPGVTFITRKGYRTDSEQERVGTDGSVKKRLATEMIAAADSNMQYDSLRFTATISASDADAIHIRVSPRSIKYIEPKDETKPQYASLMVMAATFEKNGKEIARKGTAFNVPRKKSDTRPPAEVDFAVDPSPKAVRVRVVVRDEFTGHIGTVDMPLTPNATAASYTKEEDATGPEQKPESPTSTTPPAS